MLANRLCQPVVQALTQRFRQQAGSYSSVLQHAREQSPLCIAHHARRLNSATSGASLTQCSLTLHPPRAARSVNDSTVNL